MNQARKNVIYAIEQPGKNVLYCYQRGDGMYRFAINELILWKKKENRKQLIIMGARQVGKT